MAEQKCPECPTCLPGWLAQFGDLMSLLLCFFVLLLSMATMDAVKVKEAIGSFKGTLGILPGSEYMEAEKRFAPPSMQQPNKGEDQGSAASSMANPVEEINQTVKNDPKEAVTIEEAEDGFLIRLPSSLPFRDGSADITNDDTLLFIKRIALITSTLPNDIEISVRGHTADKPLSPDSPYKDNWELSVARSISVAKELIKNGVDKNKINVSGYAENRPLMSNITDEGKSKNDRVEIYFYAHKNTNQDDVHKTSGALVQEQESWQNTPNPPADTTTPAALDTPASTVLDTPTPATEPIPMPAN